MEEANRLTDKTCKPTEQQIQEFIGPAEVQRLEKFEVSLDQHYALKRELRFPFGKQDGWGYRYAHKKSLLGYVFLKKGELPVPCPLMIKERPKLKPCLTNCSLTVKRYGKIVTLAANKAAGCIQK